MPDMVAEVIKSSANSPMLFCTISVKLIYPPSLYEPLPKYILPSPPISVTERLPAASLKAFVSPILNVYVLLVPSS